MKICTAKLNINDVPENRIVTDSIKFEKFEIEDSSIVIDANPHINQIHIRETASQYKCFKEKDIITSNNEKTLYT